GNYRWIASELPYTAFAGEWTFAEALYGARPDADAAYVNDILFDAWRLSGRDVERIVHIRSVAAEFLRRCLSEVPWYEYEIVGFTSTFEQNLASLALAHLLKHAFPHIRIVFGGANWEADMGLELHRRFPFVDFVCSGEADESF